MQRLISSLVSQQNSLKLVGQILAGGAYADSVNVNEAVEIMTGAALLASADSIQRVVVFKPVRVAIFSAGDEVVAQGQVLPENCIYDTNRFTLIGLLQRMGCSVVDLGMIKLGEQYSQVEAGDRVLIQPFSDLL